MRVEVIDGVTFRDIEPGGVPPFRVDACQPDQIANSWTPALAVRRRRDRLAHDRDTQQMGFLQRLRERMAAHRPLFIVRNADLAGDMIKEGLAVCLRDGEDQRVRSYIQDQEQARKAYKGLWSSQIRHALGLSREASIEPQKRSIAPQPFRLRARSESLYSLKHKP